MEISNHNLIDIAAQVRRDILRMTNACNSGHPGGSLGCTDLFVALYFKIMNINITFDMDGKNEDLFFLSNGHISPVFYSVLARRGYFPISELGSFRKLNSRLQGHPTPHEHLPGIRIASGSLGQGLSVAIGAAISKKINGDKSIVYVLMGDGELQEGQIWEAAMAAAHHRVDNLIGIVDWNGKQIDGPNDEVISLGDLKGKWQSFGWEILETNGNNMENLIAALENAKNLCGHTKPIIILMHTKMGFGVDFMEDDHKWHGIAPNNEQLEIALGQLTSSLSDY